MNPSNEAPLGPLRGMRVIDFGHFIAGPFCSMILGDLGADVIKIENANANGDSMRALQPIMQGESAPFIWTNRNKRSLKLDLSRPEARSVAKKLISEADVLVENFSSKVMQRFELDYASVSQLNPRLIYCSVSAYGRTGALSDRPGLDPVVQADSGFMAVNGDPASGPLRTGPAIMDMSTGMMASNAVLAAIAERFRTGAGQQVEVALFDVAVTMVGYHAMNYLMTGKASPRFGNNSRDSAPTGVFHSSNGPFYLAVPNDQLFRRLVINGLERKDLADLPEYASNTSRVANKDRLVDLLNDIFSRKPREHWLNKLRESGVPAASVRELDEAMNSEELSLRGIVSQIEHPALGTVPNIRSPLHLEKNPVRPPQAAPTLGQHTREIVTELGYSDEQFASFEANGAFGR